MLSLGEKALPVDQYQLGEEGKKERETKRQRSVGQGRGGEESDKFWKGN